MRVGVEAVLFIASSLSAIVFPTYLYQGFLSRPEGLRSQEGHSPRRERESRPVFYTLGTSCSVLLVSNRTKADMFPWEPRVVEASDSKLPALSLPFLPSAMPHRQPWSFNRKKTKEAHAFLLSSFLLSVFKLWEQRCSGSLTSKSFLTRNRIAYERPGPPALFREPRTNMSLPERGMKYFTSKEWIERAIKRHKLDFLFF